MVKDITCPECGDYFKIYQAYLNKFYTEGIKLLTKNRSPFYCPKCFTKNVVQIERDIKSLIWIYVNHIKPRYANRKDKEYLKKLILIKIL